jgi:hypothetical protein
MAGMGHGAIGGGLRRGGVATGWVTGMLRHSEAKGCKESSKMELRKNGRCCRS